MAEGLARALGGRPVSGAPGAAHWCPPRARCGRACHAGAVGRSARRHASARAAATSLSIRPFSTTPAASRTISRRRSMMTSWPVRVARRPRRMWKLLEPKSTAGEHVQDWPDRRLALLGFAGFRGRGGGTAFSGSTLRRRALGVVRLREGRAAAAGGAGVRIADHRTALLLGCPHASIDLGAGSGTARSWGRR